LHTVFPGLGEILIAIAIMVSTFGCMNGMLLAGSRAYYAMAKDRLFFKSAGGLNRAGVPGISLLLQGVWAAFLVLPRTFDTTTGRYGNLYSNLLDYVVSAMLIFYILTIFGVFRLRRLHPSWERPYRTFGYPIVPALYILGAATILVILFAIGPPARCLDWRSSRQESRFTWRFDINRVLSERKA
jgi:basic amino acid/polyamine antiporter, APA family